jgi:hypothetical protein
MGPVIAVWSLLGWRTFLRMTMMIPTIKK